jgi:hypothetical protein
MDNESKTDVKLVLLSLFAQMFLKENLDTDEYLQSHINKAAQTIPMSAKFHVYIFICIYVHENICEYKHICLYITLIYAYISKRTQKLVCSNMEANMCEQILMYIYVCVCVYIYIYLHTYLYIKAIFIMYKCICARLLINLNICTYN